MGKRPKLIWLFWTKIELTALGTRPSSREWMLRFYPFMVCFKTARSVGDMVIHFDPYIFVAFWACIWTRLVMIKNLELFLAVGTFDITHL